MKGLLKRAPIQAVALAIFIIGLVGLPPFAGFLAKYEVFACLVQQAQLQDRPVLWVLLGVGVVNTVIALGYYGKLLKIALFDIPDDVSPLPISFRQNIYVLALAVFIVVGIFFWDLLTTMGTQYAVGGFQPGP
jgi:NADH-quinone oxidoreductase subunit N